MLTMFESVVSDITTELIFVDDTIPWNEFSGKIGRILRTVSSFGTARGFLFTFLNGCWGMLYDTKGIGYDDTCKKLLRILDYPGIAERLTERSEYIVSSYLSVRSSKFVEMLSEANISNIAIFPTTIETTKKSAVVFINFLSDNILPNTIDTEKQTSKESYDDSVRLFVSAARVFCDHLDAASRKRIEMNALRKRNILMGKLFTKAAIPTIVLNNDFTTIHPNDAFDSLSKKVLSIEHCNCTFSFGQWLCKEFPGGDFPMNVLEYHRKISMSPQIRMEIDGKDNMDIVRYAALVDNQMDAPYLIVSYLDVTEDVLRKENAEKQIWFGKIASKLSTLFLKHSNENRENIINESLKIAGVNVKVDRTYIFHVDMFRRVMSNTHEWCANGITPQISNLQNMSVDHELFYGWSDILRKKAIIVSDIDDPNIWLARFPSVKKTLVDQGIKALIVFPIFHNGDFSGFVGFDSVREKRQWSISDITILKQYSQLLSIL